MTDIFLSLLNVSITTTWVALAVLILRFCLKKAPKWITCLLWGMVGLRLLLPFSIESGFSLIPSAQTLPQDIALSPNPSIHSGIGVVDQVVNPILSENFAPQVTTSVSPVQQLLTTASVIWAVGVGIMLVYCVLSYIRLYRKVRVSVLFRDTVYWCDQIETPFILGIVKPRICLPSGLPAEQTEHVIAHEKAHLKRFDHWWKPVSFVLLSVYWFNPVLWVAYILLCRDIELACDEKVIRSMQPQEKKDYAETLAYCGVRRKMIAACPLAFGEVGVKDRIKTVLHYKKPAFWLILLGMVACTTAAICLLTNPKPCIHVYQGKITQSATCTESGVETFTCSKCYDSYTEPVAMLSHTYGEAVVLVESTCTAAGSRQFTCQSCGSAKTEELEMAAHTYGTPYVSKEPNCTETGESSAPCTVCNGVFVVEQLPTNDVHDIKEDVIKAATCTAAGEAKKSCSRCSHTETVVLEMLSHDYVVTSKGKGTCTHPGLDLQKCKNCNAERVVTGSIDPDAHRWVDMGYYWPDQCLYCGETRSDGQTRNNSYSVLDGTTYQSGQDDTKLPGIQWAPEPGQDPTDFSWLYP